MMKLRYKILYMTYGAGLVVLGIILPITRSEAKSSIYAELLGNGVLYSLNYEYFIKDYLPIRIGFERVKQTDFGMTFGDEKTTIVIGGYQTFIPVSISKLYGKGKHKLELGGGILYSRLYLESSLYGKETTIGEAQTEEVEARNDFDLTGIVGYRYQPPSRGVLFRFAYTPLIANKRSRNENILFWMGLSLGYTF